MDKKPFFSVVLPTLNRAKYLPFAIKSVLNQSFEDFELIVSDNSSTDNTREVVESFADQRLRYAKTSEKLPMDASWEFALAQAKGEYVTFLGDDDAHSGIYLESLAAIIEKHQAKIISCLMADYVYRDSAAGNQETEPETLISKPFTNRLSIYDTSEIVRQLFVEAGVCAGDAGAKIQIPQLINTVYHHSVFSGIKTRLGKVFPRILSGDYYLAVIALSFADKYYYLDSPLSFHGISAQSTTTSISNRKEGLSLKDTQPELAFFAKVPVELFVPYNFSTDALLLAKSHLAETLDHLNIDLTGYFINIFRHLHAIELEGYNIDKERADFDQALKAQPPAVRQKVGAVVFSKTNTVKNKLRKTFFNYPIYQFARNMRNAKTNESLMINSGDKTFFDILSCAAFIDNKFLKEYETRKP